MKKYEKVPRWDHPVLEDTELWSSEDLTVLEKMDGQNYKFFLLDSSEDYYKNNVINNEDLPTDISRSEFEDGDIIFGTKNVIRGTTGLDKERIDSIYSKAYDALSKVDTDRIRYYQNEYGPMIFFAEHMIPHSIKSYYGGQNKVPSLLGFDIYCKDLDNRTSFASNPYEQKFDGYLELEESKSIFEDIGLEFVPILDGLSEKIQSEEDVKNIDIPFSEYSETPAEGILIRSDKLKLRSKKRSEYFKEINKKYWGMNPDEATNGEEYIVSKIATTPRIKKIFEKIKNKNKKYDILAKEVLKDIWLEELEEIRKLDKEINPYNMIPLIEERVEGELEKIKKTYEVIDKDINPELEKAKVEIQIESIEPEEDENIEKWIVDNYIKEELIDEVINNIIDGDLEKRHIDEVYKKTLDEFWYRNWENIMCINAYFKPGEIENLTAKKTAEIVSSRVESKD